VVDLPGLAAEPEAIDEVVAANVAAGERLRRGDNAAGERLSDRSATYLNLRQTRDAGRIKDLGVWAFWD
jgi:hypothetical protein